MSPQSWSRGWYYCWLKVIFWRIQTFSWNKLILFICCLQRFIILQAFHICQSDGRADGFLCPNGTVFNQQYFICDWWYNVQCDQSESLYSLNALLYDEKAYFGQLPWWSFPESYMMNNLLVGMGLYWWGKTAKLPSRYTAFYVFYDLRWMFCYIEWRVPFDSVYDFHQFGKEVNDSTPGHAVYHYVPHYLHQSSFGTWSLGSVDVGFIECWAHKQQTLGHQSSLQFLTKKHGAFNMGAIDC